MALYLPPPAAGSRAPGDVPIHPKVRALLARQQYEQRTPEWYEVRKGLMTASDAAGALGIPAYKGQRNVRENLLEQKVSGTFTGNHMTRWGQQNEDAVRDRAMDSIGEVAWEVGLVVHETLPWLGASPDGVTNTGRLVEIKCPYKRVPVPNEVPHHYWPQIQVQLECTDLDECYFVQWQPAHLSPDDTERFTITVVERDRKWFADNVDALKEFWSDLMERRKTYVPPPPPTFEACVDYSVPIVENYGSTPKRTFVIDSDSGSDSDSDDLKHLRAKLVDALAALDAWTHKAHKKKKV